MKFQKYQPTGNPPADLVELLIKKYGNKKNFDYFYHDLKKSYSFCADNENIKFIPISGYQNNQLETHIALIIDKRLPSGGAFFGFFECSEDILMFQATWKKLVKEARDLGISVLKGPINGSVWHQYRCIKQTDSSDFFKSELICESYYYNLLNSNKPALEVLYYSASREKFDIVIKKIAVELGKLSAAGFSIKEVENATVEKLRSIADLSRMIFSNNWGYTNLNEQEFLQLYSSAKIERYLYKLYLLYKGREIIGYCGTIKESDDVLICKTICILPKYQGLGLGNALAYKIHTDAQKDRFKKVIYALIREGNNIKNFPKNDATIFRIYAAFEYKI